MHKPEAMHTAIAVGVLSYLKRTRKMKLTYRRTGNPIEELFHDLGKDNVQLCSLMARNPLERMPLIGFSDANFAPKIEPEYQSTTGYAMFALNCLICCSSKVQGTKSQTAHEPELVALSLAANQAIWIQDLMLTLGFALVGHSIICPAGSERIPELGDNELLPSGADLI
jgi:hypothetical protein